MRMMGIATGVTLAAARIAVAVVGTGFAFSAYAIAQEQSQGAANGPVYEVASIKPYTPDGPMPRIMIRTKPDGFTASGVTLHMLIRQAYDVEDNQILNAPAWADSEQYEVDTKMDPADVEALDQMTPQDAAKAREHMMQALLADRFHLTLHREKRDLPVFALVVAKGGPKLHEAKPGDTYANGLQGPDGGSGAGLMRMGMGELICQGVPVENLARVLSDRLGHHVVDKTGLTGKYDFTLKWAPGEGESPMFRGAGGPGPGAGPGGPQPAPADASAPSLYTALQEQLGLKLDSQKAPVEVLVIDHAEKPTAN
jgi:bla regulator protein blaR1